MVLLFRSCRRRSGRLVGWFRYPQGATQATVLRHAHDLHATSRPDTTSLRSLAPRARCLHSAARLYHAPEPARLSEQLGEFKASLNLPQQTHDVDQLSLQHVGQNVTLLGYLQPQSNVSAKLSFAQLKNLDQTASVQLLSVGANNEALHQQFKAIRPYSVIAVSGTVQAKKQPKEAPREALIRKIHDVEVKADRVTVLNSFPPDLNFTDTSTFEPEERYLELRHSNDLRHALKFRSRLEAACTKFLVEQEGFTSVKTPLLFKSTPEGAREFLVPTRTPGQAYALPQSPQQYKQILMASGITRYFQLADCFRDEDLRADRQPEFTQLDMEMAGAGAEQVMACIERLIRHLWASSLDMQLPSEPFPRLSYEEAMAKYGSDKPDRRLDMEILEIGHMIPVELISKLGSLTYPTVEAFKFDVAEDPAITRKFVSRFMDSSDSKPFIQNPDGQPGIFIYDTRKPLGGLTPFGFEAAEVMEQAFDLEDGNLIVVQVRKDEPFSGGSTMLGNLRLVLHRAAVAQGLVKPPSGWDFLWVNQFPLFSPSSSEEPGQGGHAGIASTHHPFTAPASEEDIDRLVSDPLSVQGDHYDLVLNGVEIGGGSRRIHSAALQEFILCNVLKLDESRMQNFGHLLQVLRSGCPPHAGIALGFDRLCAVMLGKESIRDVIAFPKNGRGQDPVVGSPSTLTAEQLRTYHLGLVKQDASSA